MLTFDRHLFVFKLGDAHIFMARTTMNIDGKIVVLTSGMAVTAEIKSERRRVLPGLPKHTAVKSCSPLMAAR